VTTAIGGTGTTGEPVDISFTYGEPINRLWGIPIVGFVVRAILLIPHFIVLWLFGIAAGFTLLVSWIPVLVTGRQASWVMSVLGGYLAWTARVGAYLLLVSAGYPPFSATGPYSVMAQFEPNPQINRLWGIPLLGIAVRVLLCIPHYIALFILGIVAVVLFYFTWLPVLVMGRQATPVIDLLGGYWRWGLRVSAYVLLLTDRYPPFSLQHMAASSVA